MPVQSQMVLLRKAWLPAALAVIATVLWCSLPADLATAQDPPAEEQTGTQQLSGNPIEYESLGDGTIILQGTDDDLDILEALIRQLDQATERPVIRYKQLQNAPAADLAGRLQQLYQQVVGKRPEDKVTIVADEGSNSLLIAAPGRIIDEIVTMADELDKNYILPPLEYEVMELQHIKASDAAATLNESLPKLFQQRAGGKKALEQISIEPVDRNNTLMVTAPRQSIEQIRSLLQVIDVEAVGLVKAELLFIPLLNARAEDLAKSLEDMLKAQGSQAEKLQETILRLRMKRVGPDGEVQELPELDLEKPLKIVPEPGTNSLIIATHDLNVQPMTEIVKLLDSVPTAPEMGVDFYPLKYADAEAVAEVLRDMFDKGSKLPIAPDKEIKGAVPEGIPGKAFVYNVGVHADTRTNIVVVSGRPEQIATAHMVIKRLDVEGGVLVYKPRLFYLQHTDAERLATILTQLNEQAVAALEGRKAGVAAIDKERALILPDYHSKALIISATDDKFKEIVELAAKLDTPSEFINEIRIINCTNTNAVDLEAKIADLWQRKAELRKREDLPEDVPVVVADQRSNALVVASSTEDYEAIKKLIADLEAQPLAPLAMIRLVKIENNDSAELASMLKSLFDERLKLRGEENDMDRVAIASDAATNTMLVAASPENHAEIQRIVGELDVIPELEGVVQSFILKNADAANVMSKVKDLFDQGIYKPGLSAGTSQVAEAREKVAMIADARVNAVMVSASRPNMAIIEQLIKQMDTYDVSNLLGTTRIFQLTHADCLKVGEMLTRVFEGLKSTTESQEVFIVPTIIPVETSNALIVAGSKDGITRTEGLLKEIDKPSTSPSSIFEVYNLRYASSVKLAPKIQEMFERRVEGSDVTRTPINIQAVEGSNSIVVSASSDDHAVLSGLLGLLDVKSQLNQQLRIFNLESADSESASTLLSDLFQSQAGTAEGLANAIAVQPVPWTNSIAVWAAPGQMDDVEHMINMIDTNVPKREMMFEAIQLKVAVAEELAEAVTQALQGQGDGDADPGDAVVLSFFEQMPDGSQALRRLIRQDITIVPYVQTNSLLIMAPPESVEMLKTLVRRLDGIPPLTSEVEVFRLFNAGSEQIIQILEDIFGGEGTTGGGEGPAQVIGGVEGAMLAGALGGLQQQMTFAADPRTNSIIVAGSAQYLNLVAQLVSKLDAPADEERWNTVYKINNSTAADLATAIQEFNQQESDRLSALEDVTSEYLQREQSITVVPDESSNSMIVGVSPRFKNQYMEMIQELDRAPEQVLIEVMVIQVRLDDLFELGVEFTWQDLAFSQKAVQGPNGTILGPNKDVVIGTDLGAIGSGGGLSITVNGEDFSFLFHALQANSQAELISRPSLMVKNNEVGIIEIIEEVPIPSSSGLSEGGVQQTNITYTDAGITLEVEPHINPDGYIRLHVLPEVSSVGAPIQLSGDLQASTFQRTRLDTTITIKDGETVVIGGLIENNLTETESKVPIFGDLPVVGQLFRTNADRQRRAELLIVITATVVRAEEDAYRLSVEKRDETDTIPDRIKQSPLMKKLQVRPGEVPADIREGDLLQESEEAPEETYGPQPSIYGPPPPKGAQRVSYEKDAR